MRETLIQIKLLLIIRQDHPRVCGKHDSAVFRCCSALGSPPRMRETPESISTKLEEARITPAYAGNTHTHSQEQKLVDEGSPPRMRETPIHG